MFQTFALDVMGVRQKKTNYHNLQRVSWDLH